ncbi:MAG: ABC transporter permease [Lachnospiraceae bacterium]|nr:ABC transporter permease [Lachnospiraceae bacterium]
MKRFLRLYKIEQKLFFRSGDVFVFNLCMPVVVLLIIGFIAGGKAAGDSGMNYLQSAFASLTSVGICCSAFMSIPIVLVDYRDKKILKHFYCSPCSPARIMLADVICSAVMAMLSAVLVGAVAFLVLGYRMEGSLPAFIGAWFLTMISMFSIGLLVASLCKTTRSMSVATTILYFPMLFFSGATIPYELFPKGVQLVADMMPLGMGIRLMKAAGMGTAVESVLLQIIILILIAVVCSLVAVKTFRWE